MNFFGIKFVALEKQNSFKIIIYYFDLQCLKTHTLNYAHLRIIIIIIVIIIIIKSIYFLQLKKFEIKLNATKKNYVPEMKLKLVFCYLFF